MVNTDITPSRGGSSQKHAEIISRLRETYREIGDNLDTILDGLDLSKLDLGGEKPAELLRVMAMVTVFQYAEGLTDLYAADQVRSRADWKYAMHLPQHFPGFPYRFLCEFRRQLISHQESYEIFHTFVMRLLSYHIFERSGKLLDNASTLILGCCFDSRIADLEDAIRNMFGKLAAVYPEWLKMNTLPYWYARYGTLSGWAGPDSIVEKRERQALAMGADAYKLLEIVHGSGKPDLMTLREYRALKYQWNRQFYIEEGVLKERFLCKDGERYLCKIQNLCEPKEEF